MEKKHCKQMRIDELLRRFWGNYTFEEHIKLDHNFKLSLIKINFILK